MSAAAKCPPPVRDGILSVDPPALLGGRCRACGTLRFPRAEVCPRCQGDDCPEVALPTVGTVFTFTVVHAAPPGYAGEVPYAFGVVELPDGLRVTTTLLADELDAIAIGDRAEFELLTVGAGDERVLSYAYRVAGGSR